MKHARVAHRGAVRAAEARPETRTLHFADGEQASFDDVVWLPPIEVRTCFAVGLNYADHVAEIGFKKPERPMVFLKTDGAFTGDGGTILLPAGAKELNPECELAIVIGKQARHVSRDRAYEYIAGYTVANDFVFRDYLEDFYRPNLRVKNRDRCTPLGPWIVDAADIADPMALDLLLTVNGDVVQQGNTRNMIFPIPVIVEYLSSFLTLSPGDVILTGTPHGMRPLRPGDEVVTRIAGIGSMRNTIVAAPEISR